MLPREDVSSIGLVIMAIVALTLLPTKSKSCEVVAVYSPQRVMRQLGFNQVMVMIVGDMKAFDVTLAEARFFTRERVGRLLWPATGKVSMRSSGCAIYCRGA